MSRIQTQLRSETVSDGAATRLAGFVNVAQTYSDSTAEVVTAPGHLVNLTTRWRQRTTNCCYKLFDKISLYRWVTLSSRNRDVCLMF